MVLLPFAVMLCVAGVPLFTAPVAPTPGNRAGIDFYGLAVRGAPEPPVGPAVRAGLLQTLAGASLGDTLGCKQEVAPWDLVVSLVDGTFAPTGGAVVLLDNARCGAPEDEQTRLVVWVSDHAALVLGSVGEGTLLRLDDLNGDGFDEVVAVHSSGPTGRSFRASIGSLASGRWQLLQQLGEVARQDPATGSVSFSVVSQEPGEPWLRQEQWVCESAAASRASCRAAKPHAIRGE